MLMYTTERCVSYVYLIRDIPEIRTATRTTITILNSEVIHSQNMLPLAYSGAQDSCYRQYKNWKC